MNPISVDRPWGRFERFTHNVNSTVKIIYINKGQSLSLQSHTKRSEFWKVLRGHPLVEIDEKKTEAKEGDTFFCDMHQQHRLSAPSDDVMILEIALGTFDENDIVRLDDKYGRV